MTNAEMGLSTGRQRARSRRGIGRRTRSADRRRPRPTFEALEGRIAPATFLVVNALDGPGDGPIGSLRDAVSRADRSGDAEDLIVIAPGVGRTIDLNAGELAIATSQTIVNRSGGPVAIRQTTPGARVLHVPADAAAARLRIGGLSAAETVTITGGSAATGDGGGILVEDPATVLTLVNARVVGNAAGLATATGGGQDGGGIASAGRVELYASAVGDPMAPNQASGDGGGLHAGAGVLLVASRVEGNRAGGDGGGLFVSDRGVTLVGSRVDGNQALNVGGINAVRGGVRVLQGSQVDRNSSTATLDVAAGNFGGGGIYAGIGDVYVAGSRISGNHSVGMYSSGIVVGLGSVTVTAGSLISGNSADGPGGGIAANFGGVVTVSGGSRVVGNSGAGIGGGIVNFAGPMGGVRILGGSEVAGNTLTNAETLGGAVSVFLELIAGSVGLDLTTATGGTSAAALDGQIAQLERDAGVASDPSGTPTGALVAGGGIGTLLGASISVGGGSLVHDNVADAGVSGGIPGVVGIGGGLFSGLGPTTIAGGGVDGNAATGGGGGIWNRGPLAVVGGRIAGNAAPGSRGGGLFNAAGASATLSRALVRGNRAATGGGIASEGTLALVDAAVIANRAERRGGGIADGGTLTLRRSLVVANTPDDVARTV